jgi:hypothetical protein
MYIYIDINISPLHPSLVDDTCTSKFQGILQNSYKIATFFHHVTFFHHDLPIPGLFGTPPERLHSSGHTMGGESKQKVAWQLWKGVIHGKIWFLKIGGFPEPYVEP